MTISKQSTWVMGGVASLALALGGARPLGGAGGFHSDAISGSLADERLVIGAQVGELFLLEEAGGETDHEDADSERQ